MRIAAFLGGAALGIFGGMATALAEEEVPTWRVFVADHGTAEVTAVDLASGQAVGRFALSSPARLYVTESGRAVYAVQRDAGEVAAIDTGITIDDHGDHGDIEVEPPLPVAAKLTGKKPVHFVAHDGEVAVFFDDEGIARLASERDWLDGRLAAEEVDSGAPHHGVALRFGEHLLVSAPNREDPSALPVGIRVLDRDGQAVGGLRSCPDLHGEAASGNLLAIACAEGLLLAEAGGGEPRIRFLPYAETLPEGKTTTLLGGVGLQYFLGNYGADRLVIIDPAEEAALRLVELPTRRVHFAVDPQRVKYAYIFTEDGYLRRLDVLTGRLTDAIRLTEPYSMDGAWNLPRPRVAVAGGEIVVTDPFKSRLHVLDAATFTKAREIPLGGLPYNIVAAGGSGRAH